MDHRNEMQMGNENHNSVNQPTVARKIFIVTILVALLFIIGLWIWMSAKTNNIRKNAETEQVNLKNEAEGIIVQTHEQHLLLLAKPFVWAVRSEMMKGNMSQVNLYMNEMVKEKNFQRIALVNDKGMIVSSTNKKDVGKPFSTIGNSSDLVNNDTKIRPRQDSVLKMTSPVMGLNNRLGTLFIEYSIPRATFKQ